MIIRFLKDTKTEMDAYKISDIYSSDLYRGQVSIY